MPFSEEKSSDYSKIEGRPRMRYLDDADKIEVGEGESWDREREFAPNFLEEHQEIKVEVEMS